MCCMRLTLSPSYRQAVAHQLQTAQPLGHLRQVTYVLALLAVLAGPRWAHGAWVLRVPAKTVAAWGGACCGSGLPGAPHQKPAGRPPPLPPTQTEA
jgi:phosphate/sulfate permease